MAEVRPFRAVRYDVERAGPLERLVAPPYDVIGPEERKRYLAESPYNVVHLTLPGEEAEAARRWREWQSDGVLVRDDGPAYWSLVQEYVGPDGVARSRSGAVVSLRLEPYSRGVVLPHERTHAGPKEERLRLLRAVRAELEPIFLLYRGRLELPHEGPPHVEARQDGVTSRLWRIEDGAGLAERLADAALLIADGHHRYETALAFNEEDGSPDSAYMMVVVVPTEQEGLTIFPTHRVVERLGETNGAAAGDVEEALERLRAEPRDRAALVVYRHGRASLVEGDEGELDAALVERFAPQGVTYTPRAEEAVAAVDSGAAEAAFLLRPPTIEQIAAVAERGDVMPQKSTYFYPKLLSGLLFHPV